MPYQNVLGEKVDFFGDTKTREDRIGGIAKSLTMDCPEGICDGSGIVGTEYYDSDSHTWQPDGEKPCLCQINEHTDEDDNSAEI